MSKQVIATNKSVSQSLHNHNSQASGIHWQVVQLLSLENRLWRFVRFRWKPHGFSTGFSFMHCGCDTYQHLSSAILGRTVLSNDSGLTTPCFLASAATTSMFPSNYIQSNLVFLISLESRNVEGPSCWRINVLPLQGQPTPGYDPFKGRDALFLTPVSKPVSLKHSV
jgi:hypothetical protein